MMDAFRIFSVIPRLSLAHFFPPLSLTFPSFLAAFPTLSLTTHGPHLPRRVLDTRTL